MLEIGSWEKAGVTYPYTMGKSGCSAVGDADPLPASHQGQRHLWLPASGRALRQNRGHSPYLLIMSSADTASKKEVLLCIHLKGLKCHDDTM